MNKAQARAATAKLLQVNRNLRVMEEFLYNQAIVTLDGEHIPVPRWTSKGVYVAFKDGNEVARTAPLPKQEEPPETKAFKAEQERLEKLRKGVSTWDRFKDLGVAIVDACQVGRLGCEYGWAWQIPGYRHNDPSMFPPAAQSRHYDVIRRDGYLFKNVPEASIKWGAAEPGYEAAEVVRFRMCSQAETFTSPAGSFFKASSRIFSKSSNT